MKTLFLECNMGASGDMLMAALAELLPEPDNFIRRLNDLGIPDTKAAISKAERCGITGSHINITVGGREENEDMFEEPAHSDHSESAHHIHHAHNHGGHSHTHHHSGYKDILDIINSLDVSEEVKKNAAAVYGIIAEAEAKVHGREPENIHFHEVGTMDAIADIVGCCMLVEEIAPDRIIASDVRTGFGTVRCAHGILPVPAPATALILKGIPTYSGDIKGEMCTPTGAALLRYFADEFSNMPPMKTEKIGCGMGTREYKTANCLRAFLGTDGEENDSVSELRCCIDDMTGEEMGFATERIYESGALEVYTVPAFMKKNRPGIILEVICRQADKKAVLEAIFKHTSTIGIRESICRRYVLKREEKTVSTEYGDIRIKTSEGFGTTKTKAEYEDLAAAAKNKGISLRDIRL